MVRLSNFVAKHKIFSNNINNLNFADASYSDPLGEAPMRPKTAGGNRGPPIDDEFGDEELGDDLLPE